MNSTPIIVEDNVSDEGCCCFKVVTSAATYFYDKEGCGFTSLIDRDGNDWINYHPSGGAQGEFRGIPNMGFESFGHPGYRFGASSTITHRSATEITIHSRSNDSLWDITWNITQYSATMNVLRAPCQFWILYEGTPGGQFIPHQQHWITSDNMKRSCAETLVTEVPSPKWVAFCDERTQRSLILNCYNHKTTMDTYFPMDGEGGMTVFGFGRYDRDGLKMYLTHPYQCTFSLVETTDPVTIGAQTKKHPAA